MSNVYIKLATARLKMQEQGLKQNGQNSFAGYKYFELEDILPASNKICAELGVVIYTQFDDKMAHLYFMDAESGGAVEFTLPMSTASLKGCHEVQNLGAVQTYLKRYLYQNCYELAEGDALNMTAGQSKPTKEQVEKLNALKTAFTDQELAEFKAKYRGNIPAMIKAMSKARIAKFDAGTLHRAAEPEPAPEPQKHKWATPEQRAALEQMEQEKPETAKQTVGEPAPDMFQDDSAELYGDDPLANDKAHREEMF